MNSGLDERMRVYPRLAVAVTAVCVAGWWAAGDGWIDPAGKPVGGDFPALYAAGRLAAAGAAPSAWNVTELHPVLQAVVGGDVARLPFHYAPPLLLALAPLAVLPLGVALFLWLVAGLASAFVPLRQLGVDARELGVLAASPAVLEGVLHGQTGGFVAGLLGAGLLLVERRPWIGGALLGGLLFKPQYLLAPVVALIVAREGRALAALVLSVAAQGVVCAALFGAGSWPAFVTNIPFATRVLVEGGVAWWKLTTVAAGLLSLGVPGPVALALQATTALAAALFAAMLRTRHEGTAGTCAVLAASLLSSPFAFGYDWLLLAPALLVVARGALLRPDRALALAAVLACWLAPLAHQALAAGGVPLFGPLALVLLLVAISRNPGPPR